MSYEYEFDHANYADRVAAWGLDVGLHVALFFGTTKLLWMRHPVLLNPHITELCAFWTLAFLAYQAWFNADGRQTLGKRLLGIRVIDLEGGALTPKAALIRSLSTLLSGIFYLGYLWPLKDERCRAWHDILAHSFVVEVRDKRLLERRLSAVGALGVIAVLAATSLWDFGLAQHHYRLQTVSHAYVGLQEIAELQKLHKTTKGTYADNTLALARLSPDPAGFILGLEKLFDTDYGVRLDSDAAGFTIRAKARDLKHTPVTLSGT